MIIIINCGERSNESVRKGGGECGGRVAGDKRIYGIALLVEGRWRFGPFSFLFWVGLESSLEFRGKTRFGFGVFGSGWAMKGWFGSCVIEL